ncbi:hypothetical protein HK097_003470, partial [Rhizophlyctis rosea]
MSSSTSLSRLRRRSFSICWSCQIFQPDSIRSSQSVRSASSTASRPSNNDAARFRLSRPNPNAKALRKRAPISPGTELIRSQAPVNFLKIALADNLRRKLDAEYLHQPLNVEKIITLLRDLGDASPDQLAAYLWDVWKITLKALAKSDLPNREDLLQILIDCLRQSNISIEGQILNDIIKCLKPSRLQTAQHAKMLADEFSFILPHRAHIFLRAILLAELVKGGRAGEWKAYLDWLRDEYASAWDDERWTVFADMLARRFPLSTHRAAAWQWRQGHLSEEDKFLMERSARKFSIAMKHFLDLALSDGTIPHSLFTRTIIPRCWEITNYEKALAVLVEGRRLNVKLNSSVYNALISHLAILGDVDAVEKLFEDMHKVGVPMDATTLVRVIGGLVKDQKIDKAWDLYTKHPEFREEILTFGRGTSALKEGFVGDEKPFGWTLADALLSLPTPDLQKATQILVDCRKNGVMPVVQSGFLLRRLIEFGQNGEAFRLLRDEFGYCVGEGSMKLIAEWTEEAVDALCKIGRRTEAKLFLERLQRDGIGLRHTTFNIMMSAAVRNQDIQDVWRWRDEMRKRGFKPSVQTYTIILNAYMKSGNLDSAAEVLNEMRKEGIQPTVVTYNVFLQGLVNAGQFEEAELLAKDMDRNGVEWNEYTWPTVMHGYIRFGRWEDARRVMEMIQGMAGEQGFSTVAVVGYKIKECLRDGKVREAEEELWKWYDEVKTAKAYSLDNERSLLNMVVDGYLQVGEYESAKRVVERVNREGKVSDFRTNNVFLLFYAGRGMFGEFDKFLEELEAKGEGCSPEYVYTAALKAAKKIKDRDLVRKYHNALEATGIVLDSGSFAADISALTSVRDFDTAARMVKQAEGVVKPDIMLHNTIVDFWAKQGKAREMERAYMQMLRPTDPFATPVTPDLFTASVLINGYGIAGEWSKALG